MRDACGQSADRRHGLRLAQPLLGLPARGDIGIQRDEAAAGQRIAPDFELTSARARPARSCPWWRRSAAAPVRRATSASTSTGPNSPAATWPRRMSSIGRPTRRMSGRHAGELRKVLVPRHQAKIAIDHHDAVAHAGQGRLQDRRSCASASWRRRPVCLRAQQQYRQQQHQQRDAAGEHQRVRAPSRPPRASPRRDRRRPRPSGRDPAPWRRHRRARRHPDRERPVQLPSADCTHCREDRRIGDADHRGRLAGPASVHALPSRMLTTAIRPRLPRSTSR